MVMFEKRLQREKEDEIAKTKIYQIKLIKQEDLTDKMQMVMEDVRSNLVRFEDLYKKYFAMYN